LLNYILKIVLSTFGSRGDVQPMLALCLGLQAAGHEVLLIGPPEKAAWAAELACPYQPAGSDLTALLKTLKAAHTARSALVFLRFVRRQIALQFETLPSMVQSADMIVAASLCFGLASMAEALRIPYRFITFAPQVMPSRYHPFPGIRHQRRPRWFNGAGWRLAKAMDRFNLVRLVNEYRRKMGLLPVDDLLVHIMGSKVIVATDAAVAAVPPDIKTEYIQTGYMHLNQPERRLPELEAFLAAGTMPIYAGFGSMPPRDQARQVPLIVKAARCAGRRVVISRFWEEPHARVYGDDVFLSESTPTGSYSRKWRPLFTMAAPAPQPPRLSVVLHRSLSPTFWTSTTGANGSGGRDWARHQCGDPNLPPPNSARPSSSAPESDPMGKKPGLWGKKFAGETVLSKRCKRF
jgi:UDP:flavonoid glycosyltransferase YjiC (YdhE family)